MQNEIGQKPSQPTTRHYDLLPDLSADDGPVVSALKGIYGLALACAVVIQFLICLAPLIPFALLLTAGALIDKLVMKVRRPSRRASRNPYKGRRAKAMRCPTQRAHAGRS
jgi:hypothetical protein